MTQDKINGRLLIIAKYIEQGNTINISLLAKRIGCSTRTIYRDWEKYRKALAATNQEREKVFSDSLW